MKSEQQCCKKTSNAQNYRWGYKTLKSNRLEVLDSIFSGNRETTLFIQKRL